MKVLDILVISAIMLLQQMEVSQLTKKLSMRALDILHQFDYSSTQLGALRYHMESKHEAKDNFLTNANSGLKDHNISRVI